MDPKAVQARAVGSPFGDLIVAMVTPFTADGRVDFDAAAALSAMLVDEGCDGLVVCGTAGEASTLADDEKEALFRLVKETVGDRAWVIAGTGTNDTAHSRELAGRAARAGADGQLVVTPYYNKPTQAGVLAHFTQVAAAADLPVMLYDIPGRAGIDIGLESMLRLGDNPKIRALKDAKADFTAATQVMAATGIAVYAGDDALALPWMAAGAAGLVSVSAHAAPRRFRQLVDALKDSDLPRARRLYFELAPVVHAVMGRMPGAVAAKQVLKRQGFLPSAAVRLPLMEPSVLETALLWDDITAAALAFD